MIDDKPIALRFEAVRPSLDERARRLHVAAEAHSAGHGGVAATARATGVARSTIGRGLKDLRDPHGDSVLELLHISRQKFDRLIRSGACILVVDEICWRWNWRAWHAWCANSSGIL
jgi:DNA-binding phage protein